MLSPQSILKKAQVELSDAPEGKLYLSSCRGTTQFYCRHKDGKKEYLSKTDITQIQKLSQKLYNRKVVDILKHQDKLNYNPRCLSDIYKSLPEAVKPYITPYEIPVEDKVKNWMAEPYKTNTKYSDGLKYRTDNGDLVRSKSEVIIANKLYNRKIPYRYECELRLKDNITVFPDFTIMNPHSGKVYILEHFGLLDNSEYADTFVKKLKLYTDNGFIIGKNFLFTCETSETAFDPNYLNTLIDYYLT